MNQLSATAYNKFGTKKTLINNWWEENELFNHTGVHRSNTNPAFMETNGVDNTFDRCFGQKELDKDFQSSTEYRDKWGQFIVANFDKLGAREQQEYQKMIDLINGDLQQQEQQYQQSRNQRHWETTTGEDFDFSNKELVINTIGKREMLTQDRKPIVGGPKDKLHHKD